MVDQPTTLYKTLLQLLLKVGLAIQSRHFILIFISHQFA